MENQDAFSAWYDNEVYSGREPGRCSGMCYAINSVQPNYIKELEEMLKRNNPIATIEPLKANSIIHSWISVEDELPKKCTNKVIVFCKNGYVGFGHYEDYKGEKTWFNLESGKPFSDWAHDESDDYDVTHWMPLPKPPKD